MQLILYHRNHGSFENLLMQTYWLPKCSLSIESNDRMDWMPCKIACIWHFVYVWPVSESIHGRELAFVKIKSAQQKMLLAFQVYINSVWNYIFFLEFELHVGIAFPPLSVVVSNLVTDSINKIVYNFRVKSDEWWNKRFSFRKWFRVLSQFSMLKMRAHTQPHTPIQRDHVAWVVRLCQA